MKRRSTLVVHSNRGKTRPVWGSTSANEAPPFLPADPYESRGMAPLRLNSGDRSPALSPSNGAPKVPKLTQLEDKILILEQRELQQEQMKEEKDINMKHQEIKYKHETK